MLVRSVGGGIIAIPPVRRPWAVRPDRGRCIHDDRPPRGVTNAAREGTWPRQADGAPTLDWPVSWAPGRPVDRRRERDGDASVGAVGRAPGGLRVVRQPV